MFQLNQPTKKLSIIFFCFAVTKPYLNKWVGYVAALITKITIGRCTENKIVREKEEIFNVMNLTNLCSILLKGYKDNIS